ncbi:hypothetical protein B0H63DRAFT_526475 [Podospora didyma]|uniref:Isochorismatase-like domain-containing protein n=1 Tax=Podospora didyma TaxID=330526 RepID=A0AAE0KFG5_9PEZI|nr:hypothetical protein B0H63DRAFT_526475 [Podospora didyma]
MRKSFLSSAMGHSRRSGHDAPGALLSTAFPAAREAGIRIAHISWGISDEELTVLPPVIFSSFGYNEGAAHGSEDKFTEKRGAKDGSEGLAGELWKSFDDSQNASMPPVRFYKNRLSGFWAGGPSALLEYLKKQSITTLLSAGVNTDQCVLASMQDARNLAYGTVLLGDGCETGSPDYTRLIVEFDARNPAAVGIGSGITTDHSDSLDLLLCIPSFPPILARTGSTAFSVASTSAPGSLAKMHDNSKSVMGSSTISITKASMSVHRGITTRNNKK